MMRESYLIEEIIWPEGKSFPQAFVTGKCFRARGSRFCSWAQVTVCLDPFYVLSWVFSRCSDFLRFSKTMLVGELVALNFLWVWIKEWVQGAQAIDWCPIQSVLPHFCLCNHAEQEQNCLINCISLCGFVRFKFYEIFYSFPLLSQVFKYGIEI